MTVEFEGRPVKKGDKIKATYPPFGESDWMEVKSDRLTRSVSAPRWFYLSQLTITAHKPEPITVTITLPPEQEGLTAFTSIDDRQVLRIMWRYVAEAHKRGLI